MELKHTELFDHADVNSGQHCDIGELKALGSLRSASIPRSGILGGIRRMDVRALPKRNSTEQF